jgi:hypothetical protein
MGVWQGLIIDFLKFHPGLPCPNPLNPAGRPPLKRPYSCFRGGPSARRVACSRLLPPWTPHAVHLWEAGLPKELLEPVIPYPSMPCRHSPLKWPHSRFRGDFQRFKVLIVSFFKYYKLSVSNSINW